MGSAYDTGMAPPHVPGFVVQRLLGQGASCRVYLAREEEGLQRPVALKVFTGEEGRRAFERELAVVRCVEELRRRERCAEIVQSLSTGREGEAAWIAFEYLEGGSLLDVVVADGPLPLADAVDAIEQVGRALALLHAEGLFHRDVKPANLIRGADGRVRLADFGLSRPLDGTLSAAGSPAFAAPEVIAGKPQDGRRIDIYSLGATLAFLLCGETMLPGRPDVFALERRGVPRALQQVIVRATAARPADRLGEVEAFLGALQLAVGDLRPSQPAATLAEEPPPRTGDRRQEARDLMERCGYAAAALTMLPIPGSDLVGILPIHVGMVMGIGELYGVEMTRDNASRVVRRIGVAAGMSLLGTRVASTAAQFLLPGVGGVVGAPFNYASTLAIGTVARVYFERGESLTDAEVKALFKESLLQARRSFDPRRASGSEARALAEEARSRGEPERLEQLESEVHERPEPVSAPSGKDSAEERLLRLQVLQDEQLITPEEHAALRRHVLDEL
jgi:uncharacterized protein (DUF697 family)